MNRIRIRNSFGMTLPFALILTFIFSALVGVAYLFVSVNISQMQSSLYSMQAIAIAEGINERIKARLNTKSKIQQSPQQEKKLKSTRDESLEEGDNEEISTDDEFDEETESFDEYYADEVVKISRLITFREPPAQTASEESEENFALDPESNVEMIGSIDISRGTKLAKGIMIAVFKDEKIDLKLKDIVDETQGYKPKLPAPVIKSLIPNYCEVNSRSRFIVNGENLPNKEPTFSNKNIKIEDVRAGPAVDFLIGSDVKPGLTRFYLGSAQAEFYLIPVYDGNPRPIINEVQTTGGAQLLEIKAGKKLVIKIAGIDLYQNKSQPVVIPDIVGIIPKVKDQSTSGKEITVNLTIGKNVETGVHSLIVATEGGLSNSWLFNVLPPGQGEDFGANAATFTSSLTLLDLRTVENILPLIDEGASNEEEDNEDKSQGKEKKVESKEKTKDDSEEETPPDEAEVPEKEKLSPFANVDLETVWLLETSAMVGKITKTISEVIHREIPNVQSAIATNGGITFEGGDYKIIGQTTAMTVLVEPTYISNTLLKVTGPTEDQLQQLELPMISPAKGTEQKDQGRAKEEPAIPKSPVELGFLPGSLITAYKTGNKISELDYAVISMVGLNTIDLVPPGLMDFHYEQDEVYQFIPPIISKEKLQEEDSERHTVPQGFAISIPNGAKFKDIFKSSLDQFSELADLYTNDTNVPKDEFDLPTGYMGTSYIAGTPVYDNGNVLSGKGILIIDTRADNLGRAEGTVELNGDSKNPIDFSGIIYIHGNVRITGNVNINGSLIVDNDARGNVEFANNALGKITYDQKSIKQTLLCVPFTTKPGTVMISNKPINIEKAVPSGTTVAQKLGASSSFAGKQSPTQTQSTAQATPIEGTIVEKKTPAVKTIKAEPNKGMAEEELIDLF